MPAGPAAVQRKSVKHDQRAASGRADATAPAPSSVRCLLAITWVPSASIITGLADTLLLVSKRATAE